jgi:hypothetical protein
LYLTLTRQLRLGLSEDPDEDGLTVDQEVLLGTQPRVPDSDGDGLADGEEALVHLTDPLLADSDGDGVNDLVEMRAGTNPLLAGSVLRVVATPVSPALRDHRLNWPAAEGKRYALFRSHEVGSGNFLLLEDDVPVLGGQAEFIDVNPPPGPLYYWVTAE